VAFEAGRFDQRRRISGASKGAINSAWGFADRLEMPVKAATASSSR
jgi:hypothetical protein